MGFLLITGSANAGKTGVVHARVLSAAAGGLSATLLLPSRPEVDRAARELAATRSAGVRVTTFDAFLDELWSLLGDGRRIAGSAQRAALLRRAIGATPTPSLPAVVDRPGFIRTVDLLLRRAGESGVLDGRLASRAGGNGPARDLAAICDTYAGLLLDRGFIERSQAHHLVSALVGPGDLPDLVAINRFGSFTPPQTGFLNAAVLAGGDLLVALTYDPGSPATRAAGPLVQALEALPGVEHQRVSGAHTPSSEIAHLEHNLFRDTPQPPRGSDGDVVLSTAEGFGAESQRIVREIQHLEESGIAPGQIAVVFRDPARHETSLRRAFHEAGVRAHFDVQYPVIRTGLGRALGMLLMFFTQGMARADIAGLLLGGYAWTSADAAEQIDRDMRRRRLELGPAVYRAAAGLDPRASALLESARRLSGRAITPEDVDDWKQLLDSMLASAHAGGRPLGAEGLLDAAARRRITEAVEELAQDGVQAHAADLVALLDELTVTAGEPDDEIVQVMSAERARSRRFDAIVLGGLVASEFPQTPSEDAVNTGDVARGLTRAGVDVAPRVDVDAERMLFYQVVTGARRMLVLSRALCDDDGQPVRESQFIHELLDVYRDPVSGEWYGAPPTQRHLTLADLAQAEDAPDTLRRQRRTAALEGADDPAVLRAHRRLRARRACLSPLMARELAAQRLFTVSQIESYLKCPYQWFHQQLRPRPLAEPIDNRTRGSLAHEILARFYAAWHERGHTRVTQDTLAQALEVHDSVAAQVLAAADTPLTLVEEQYHHAARRGSRAIISRDAAYLQGFAPVATEFQFGRDGDPPEDMGTFDLAGRIDRIDASPTALVVCDYKSSRPHPRGKFAADGVVQVPLYALVARRRFGLEIAGGLYRSLSAAEDRGFVLDGTQTTPLIRTDKCTPEDITAIIDDALARATAAVEGMRAGVIEPRPASDDVCGWCAARALCERGRR